MPTQQNEFRQHLEAAILEEKRMACPNLECTHRIISKETILSAQGSLIEYACENPQCSYHEQRHFYVTYADRQDKVPTHSMRPQYTLMRQAWPIALLVLMSIGLVSYLPIRKKQQAIAQQIEQLTHSQREQADYIRQLKQQLLDQQVPQISVRTAEKKQESFALGEWVSAIQEKIRIGQLDAAKADFRQSLEEASRIAFYKET